MTTPRYQDANSVAFERFHDTNPWVYRELCRLVREWRTRNPERQVGLMRFYSYLRFDVTGKTNGIDYRVSNNHSAYYSRLMMHREPDLAGVFHVRPCPADWWLTDLIAAENGEEPPYGLRDPEAGVA